MAKERITLEIDRNTLSVLEKRAKKEMMSIEELAADILRRSAVSSRLSSTGSDNVQDKFLTFFSRKSKKRK